MSSLVKSSFTCNHKEVYTKLMFKECLIPVQNLYSPKTAFITVWTIIVSELFFINVFSSLLNIIAIFTYKISISWNFPLWAVYYNLLNIYFWAYRFKMFSNMKINYILSKSNKIMIMWLTAEVCDHVSTSGYFLSCTFLDNIEK